jgi:hypothetical protein
MFRFLYSEQVENVLKAVTDILAGHVSLDEWLSIMKILKSRRRPAAAFSYCPTVCRPWAWAIFLSTRTYKPRSRAFDSLMLYLLARQPGPFNSTSLAAHLSIHWPSEARARLEELLQAGFLYRTKQKARVTYWLAPPLAHP